MTSTLAELSDNRKLLVNSGVRNVFLRNLIIVGAGRKFLLKSENKWSLKMGVDEL